MAFWVVRLNISDTVAQKLRHKHQLEPSDVRDQIQCVTGLQAIEDHDEVKGFRMYVKIEIDKKPLMAVLFPPKRPEENVWNLGTVYPRR